MLPTWKKVKPAEGAKRRFWKPGLHRAPSLGTPLLCTDRDLALKADIKMLLLRRLEAAEGYAGLPNEFVVAQLVLITHGDPGGKGQGQSLWGLNPLRVGERASAGP